MSVGVYVKMQTVCWAYFDLTKYYFVLVRKMSGFQYSLLKDVYNMPNEEPVPRVERVERLSAVPVQHVQRMIPLSMPVYYDVPPMPPTPPMPLIRPTRLTRLDTMMDQEPPTHEDDMLPSLWWIVTYMGLAALTAIGIRTSS